ncbi:copper amine oxidase N-terminal domain-containing protein [Paenibacillus aceris]|uniref:Copper amine oxidase-like N-terminal domain-containing protein n=1 Tax=Paenibacillus aceris TaxID=869555 RepID=A0ABS4I9G6_9BACL|nr:copper amine oxidase N-terminal domain-containing protein [Paenibacillus aceris]MBP1966714.1 hypothetical protein [Paenibacillus aceris]NHW34976.1 copper amine oxidase N-terminal domain-containing protein [Paenibacillus aceris]
MLSKTAKKPLLLSALLVLVWNYVPLTAFASAVNESTSIKLILDDTAATINDKHVTLQAAPHLVHDTTMIPLRFVSEALGATVKWDVRTQGVELSYHTKLLTMQIGSTTAKANGTLLSLEQAPFIENETTFVPIRFIAENFQQTVTFDEQTRMITIYPSTATNVNSTPPAKKRLVKPTIDNLTSQVTTKIPRTGIIFDGLGNIGYNETVMISDSKDNLYFISEEAISGFSLKKMNLSKGTEISLQTMLSFNDEKFDFMYEKGGSKSKFLHYEFIPKSLYYDRFSDRIFAMGRDFYNYITVFYQVYPSVKMIAYDTTSELDTKTDFIQPSRDGQTYWISNSFKNTLYTAREGERLSTYTNVNGERMHHLVPLVDNGSLYTLDRESKSIREIHPDGGATVIAKLDVNVINTAITHDGYYYITDDKQFYRVNVKGEIEPYANLEDAIYNKGIYNMMTGQYDPTPTRQSYSGTAEPQKMTIGVSPQFTIDSEGNILIYDSLSMNIRKITIFEQ